MDRLQRELCRKRGLVRRLIRWRRAEAPHLASRRRYGARLDARWKIDRVLLRARKLGAERYAALLDRSRARRRRRAHAASAGESRKNFARRHAHRVSHEYVMGRGAPQLSRRAESAYLDCRPENVRSRLASV